MYRQASPIGWPACLCRRLVSGILSALAAGVLLAAPGTEQNTTVEGRVLNFTTDQPVAAVDVELLDSRQRRVGSSITNDDGAFRFGNVRPGSYQLRARSIGYREVTTPEFSVAVGPINLVVRIAVDAVPLAPLEVVGRPALLHPNLALSDFFERSQRKIGGVFIMREEIEQRQPARVSSLLQTVGSISVVNNARGGVIHNSRTQCQPTVYMDGVIIFAIGGSGSRFNSAYQAVNSIEWTELEGLEVYRGAATVPAQFSGSRAACGVIAMWRTR